MNPSERHLAAVPDVAEETVEGVMRGTVATSTKRKAGKSPAPSRVPLPGPYAHTHTEGYRRMGRRRKRHLRVARMIHEPALTEERGITRARRRAVRAG